MPLLQQIVVTMMAPSTRDLEQAANAIDDALRVRQHHQITYEVEVLEPVPVPEGNA